MSNVNKNVVSLLNISPLSEGSHIHLIKYSVCKVCTPLGMLTEKKYYINGIFNIVLSNRSRLQELKKKTKPQLHLNND